MKRFYTLLFATALTAAVNVTAADDIKLKLADSKVTPGQGVSSDLAGYNDGEEKIFFYAPGTAEWTFKVADDGEYTLLIKASCDPAQGMNAKFKVTLDGKAVGEEVTLTSEGEKEYKVVAKLKKGENKLGITFTNDVYKEGEYDRNLYLHGVTVKK
ncbi:MAG: carbohydrate-binding domain-containing protein [Verrucomicrobiota bacterium]